jgi:hypothetical protein
MKWNDIRNNFQKTVRSATTLSEKVIITPASNEPVHIEHGQRNRIMIGGIFLVIIIACIALFFILTFSKKGTSEIISQDQSVFIENYLQENNPEPVSQEQSQAIQELLDDTVTTDTVVE